MKNWKHAAAATICGSLLAYAAPAIAQGYAVPRGDLAQALKQLAQQTGLQMIYRPDKLAGAVTAGSSGSATPEAALAELLKGTGFEARRDPSGVQAIVREAAKRRTIAFQSQSSVSGERMEAAPAMPAPPAEAAASDIIVTARKREETLIDVPVAITAVTGAELQRRGISSIDGLARIVPQLVTGDGGNAQGGNIVLRGISGSDANPFADQAVSFNIDGVQVARSTIRRLAQMDMQQVEVLKGPQALFYGKNSPGGVISIRTGDPTQELQGKASVGYEFNAHEWRGEGYVSGPITDTLGFRVAAYGSKMRGWVENITPRSEITAPRHRFAPRTKEFAVRGTLKFEPTDSFDARLKFTYGEIHGDGYTSNLQLVACPGGAPQSGQIDNCRADDKVSTGARTDNFSRRYPRFGTDNQMKGDQKQILIGYEMNYRPSDELTLTSVTGLYHQKDRNLINVTATYVPARMLASDQRLSFTELSEEIRLTSDFDGPLNFMMGGHFQTSKASQGVSGFYNGTNFTTVAPLVPLVVVNNLYKQKGSAYSAFLQMQWDITDQLELSAGGRYSYEKKRLPVARSQTGVDPTTGLLLPLVPIFAQGSKDSWNDFSPEVTLSYHPDRNLNIYGSYKHGFISGGFNSGGSNVSLPLNYDQQTVKGFEAGAKASLLDGALTAGLALYTYDIRGLQVSILTQGTTLELKNVGKVRSKGGEFDFAYRTPLEGLTLHGAVAYNKGQYNDYFAGCYRGQTKARGCAFVPVPGQPGQGVPAPAGVNGSLQNLAGTQLVRAPEWTGNVGFDYETPVTSGLKLGLSTSMTFSASYLTDAASNPFARVPNYQLFDATVRLAEQDDRWEIALIGRNLTDEYYWTRASDSPFTGTAPGNETGPAIYGDLQAVPSRGREIMLRVSTRF
ncbi:TonB-dependent receptor [Sphingobium sp. AN641]|uniref:TonB-dependent receptor n=1 Tax=Sphingobium sp. AN641 TaxID=3133443 RepID=UPI0030C081A2